MWRNKLHGWENKKSQSGRIWKAAFGTGKGGLARRLQPPHGKSATQPWWRTREMLLHVKAGSLNFFDHGLDKSVRSLLVGVWCFLHSFCFEPKKAPRSVCRPRLIHHGACWTPSHYLQQTRPEEMFSCLDLTLLKKQLIHICEQHFYAVSVLFALVLHRNPPTAVL